MPVLSVIQQRFGFVRLSVLSVFQKRDGFMRIPVRFVFQQRTGFLRLCVLFWGKEKRMALERCDFRKVRDALLLRVRPVGRETVPLEESAGRVLAQAVVAGQDVPSFDRSPYDGYAFRSEDVAGAGPEHPVTLRVTDYIAAGDVPHVEIVRGTAARLMTGAPVPCGADAVLPFERTSFTEEEVRISEAPAPGTNIVRAGEDVRRGTVLCGGGREIDAGLAGTLAGQGIFAPLVYGVPMVGVISTGTELLRPDEKPAPGRIYNTNRYSLQAACARAGCRSTYLGTASDSSEEIAALISEALGFCDAVILSGGVSVGDYDCTPAGMELAGVEILARGLSLKPGMAGAYGIFCGGKISADAGNPAVHFTREAEKPAGMSLSDPKIIATQVPGEEKKDAVPPSSRTGIPVMALSGNPAACMTAFYAVVLPVLKKRMGFAEVLPPSVRVRMDRDYDRRIGAERLLRGTIDLSRAVQSISIPKKQGNQMLSSLAGTNAFAVIPAGGALREGDAAEAFLI